MNSASEISIGFLRTHPQSAVSVLEGLDTADAAAFLKDVPDDLVGRAFEFMQPLVAAAVLGELKRKKAAAVLQIMDLHGRSRILRVLDDRVMAAIMAEMPKNAARAIARALQFPEGSTGAWMSADVPVIEATATVSDCLEKLRALPDRVRNQIFVVDSSDRFYGVVDLAELLRSPGDIGVDSIADPTVRHLSPYARLSSIVGLPAWDTALSMPVVDAKKRLLGALHFDRLREGLQSERRAAERRPMGQMLAHVAEALLACAAGLAQGPAAKPALSRPLGERED